MLIGVTSDILLAKKINRDKIEPFEKRCRNVTEFLRRLCGPKLVIDVFELNDPAG